MSRAQTKVTSRVRRSARAVGSFDLSLIPRCGLRAGGAAVAVVALLLQGAPARATTDQYVGISIDSLQILDVRAVRGRASTILRARDDRITMAGLDEPKAIAGRVRIEYADSAALGEFIIPSGPAEWVSTPGRDVAYFNREAPLGSSQVKRFTMRFGGSLKMVAADVGDPPVDIVVAGPPQDGVFVTVEVSNGGTTTWLCARMTRCEHVLLANGAGARLTCRWGLADPTCRRARPVYGGLTDVRYGGPRTVAVLGDSITVEAESELRRHLAETSWYTFVAATTGRLFRDQQAVAVSTAASEPHAAILNLGTNDLACIVNNALNVPCGYPDFDVTDLIADARTMVAALAPGACVIGTTVWFGGGENPVNTLWWQMAAGGELRGVVPWFEYLHSLSGEERAPLLADDIGHLTPAGADALAALTTQTVNASCGP